MKKTMLTLLTLVLLAVEVLDGGGNAFDAAVAALLVLNVTHGEAASFLASRR
ncbi:MAG: hypothetical protein ACE5I1_24200 [bacterium]